MVDAHAADNYTFYQRFMKPIVMMFVIFKNDVLWSAILAYDFRVGI